MLWESLVAPCRLEGVLPASKGRGIVTMSSLLSELERRGASHAAFDSIEQLVPTALPVRVAQVEPRFLDVGGTCDPGRWLKGKKLFAFTHQEVLRQPVQPAPRDVPRCCFMIDPGGGRASS